MGDEQEQSVLRFDNVSLSFGDAPALRNVSFEMLAGETRIVFGAAGSGKTVLLKTALGLLKPDAGSVYVFGQEITGLPEEELFAIRSRMGVLFQEGGLFDSLTIEDNVGYPLLNQPWLHCPPDQVQARVEEALRFVELEHTLEKFPSELSGGMRRRVGIARAVVTEPRLVLYDSPTAGLDPITAYTIIALIVKERDVKNTTTLMATHRYQDGHFLANFRYQPAGNRLEPAGRDRAAIRTRFMVLEESRIVFEGTQAELEASNDPYLSKFVRRQE
ncbi:MAG: ATP-binding cassette domain-containing protein [Acidobacteriota bacterium]